MSGCSKSSAEADDSESTFRIAYFWSQLTGANSITEIKSY